MPATEMPPSKMLYDRTKTSQSFETSLTYISSRDAACEQCFKDAVPVKSLTGKGGKGGRGGRGKRAAKEKVGRMHEIIHCIGMYKLAKEKVLEYFTKSSFLIKC